MITLGMFAKNPDQCFCLVGMDLHYEQDVVVARQRARQAAKAAGIEMRRLSSVMTACSEVIRNAWKHAGGGHVEVWVYLNHTQPVWGLHVTDVGPGKSQERFSRELSRDAASQASGERTGLAIARELADHFDIHWDPDHGTEVLIGFNLPPGTPFQPAHWKKIADEFHNVEPQSAYDAVRSDQEELLRLTEQLQEREEELRRVNAELETTNKGILALYVELEGKAEQLEKANRELQVEIQERQRAEAERERLHRQLLESSRLAGKAEVASGVLHNIGNALNSVNVSVQMLQQKIQDSSLSGLPRVVELLDAHADHLAEFLTRDPKGTNVLPYLRELARRCEAERLSALDEVDSLAQSVHHITRIVMAQQCHARVAGTTEEIPVDDLLEDALLIHADRARNLEIDIEVHSEAKDVIRTDRHKALQILVNLIGNAIDAIEESDGPERRLTLATRSVGNQVYFEIRDTGVGISEEIQTKVFQYGFTTKPQGHGFGLHSCALTAKELGGVLTASSDGAGKGALFTLCLPLHEGGEEACSTNRKIVCAS